MKSNSRTDENLIKRAKYGGRNVTGLAILASVAAVLLLSALLMMPASLGPGSGFAWFAAAIVGVAVAYWMLAIMTRQGETLGLSILLWLFGIQLILSILGLLIIYATKGGATGWELLGVIIPLLIFVALAGNRSDLIELQRRGLSESVFGPGRPPRHLTVLGGAMLIGAQIAAVLVLLVPSIKAARTASECHDFLLMLSVEEQALKQAMGNPVRPGDKQFWATALEAAERLRDKAQQVKAQAAYGTRIRPIAATYLQATERWRIGTADALAAGRMTRQARATLQEGDDLRDEAYAEFQRSFPGIGQRPK